MNKMEEQKKPKRLVRIILAILGGIDTTIYLFTPILLVALWVSVGGFGNWNIGFYILGLFATLFRGIKISGFMK